MNILRFLSVWRSVVRCVAIFKGVSFVRHNVDGVLDTYILLHV